MERIIGMIATFQGQLSQDHHRVKAPVAKPDDHPLPSRETVYGFAKRLLDKVNMIWIQGLSLMTFSTACRELPRVLSSVRTTMATTCALPGFWKQLCSPTFSVGGSFRPSAHRYYVGSSKFMFGPKCVCHDPAPPLQAARYQQLPAC